MLPAMMHSVSIACTSPVLCRHPSTFADSQVVCCLQIHVRAASVMPGPQLTTIERAFLPGLSEESLQVVPVSVMIAASC